MKYRDIHLLFPLRKANKSFETHRWDSSFLRFNNFTCCLPSTSRSGGLFKEKKATEGIKGFEIDRKNAKSFIHFELQKTAYN